MKNKIAFKRNFWFFCVKDWAKIVFLQPKKINKKKKFCLRFSKTFLDLTAKIIRQNKLRRYIKWAKTDQKV